MSTVYVKTNSQYSVVGTFYRKNNNVWGTISEQEFLSYLSDRVFVYNNMQILRFEIAAPNTVASETCQCAALLNDSTITTGISWSIISGSTYALIDNSGLLSIQNTADNSDIIIGASYLGLSTTHNMNVTYRAGSTAETTTEVVVDESGNSTTTGNNARHDIEYQMWLHEGHIASIRNFPQLLFTSQWQLFDIAVSNRNEGYTICLDGETTSIDDNLRRLNNKGLVERDHTTKKDTFYLYKAEWSSENFVHICGKDYTKKTDRVIKCYTNDGSTLSMYVNNTFVETVNVTDHIALFAARNFSDGDVIRVESSNNNYDEFTF